MVTREIVRRTQDAARRRKSTVHEKAAKAASRRDAENAASHGEVRRTKTEGNLKLGEKTVPEKAAINSTRRTQRIIKKRQKNEGQEYLQKKNQVDAHYVPLYFWPVDLVWTWIVTVGRTGSFRNRKVC